MTGRLDSKVVLVSGGARGQGRSHAVTFAREGASVVVFDIAESLPGLFYELASEADLRETQRLVEQSGGRALALKADARDADALQRVVDAALSEFGRIDRLCINHGIMDHGSWDLDEHTWDQVVSINLKGAWITCRAVIPALIDAGGGAISITASLGGAIKPYANLLPYCAAKAGLAGMAQSLAVDLAPHNIRVNVVAPSGVASPMFMNQPTWTVFAGGKLDATADDAAQVARHMHLLPGVPWIETQDVSNAHLYLLSDDARYITGTTLTVDAGAACQPNGIPESAMSEAIFPRSG